MVTARFGVLLADGTRLDEADIPRKPAAASARIGELAAAEGRLSIEHDGVLTEMGDTLGLLIGEFCLRGLAELRATHHVEIDFMDHEEIVDITSSETEVTLAGARFGTRVFPAEPYVTAMTECGERYVALARALWRDDPENRERLAGLEAELRPAAATGRRK
jgi:hypothetical protein